MPWILNMSGFPVCQGSQYNEDSLVLEQVTLIFEMEQFLIGNPFKTKVNQTLIQVLVTLNKLLFPRILFLRIICNAVTFPRI